MPANRATGRFIPEMPSSVAAADSSLSIPTRNMQERTREAALNHSIRVSADAVNLQIFTDNTRAKAKKVENLAALKLAHYAGKADRADKTLQSNRRGVVAAEALRPYDGKGIVKAEALRPTKEFAFALGQDRARMNDAHSLAALEKAASLEKTSSTPFRVKLTPPSQSQHVMKDDFSKGRGGNEPLKWQESGTTISNKASARQNFPGSRPSQMPGTFPVYDRFTFDSTQEPVTRVLSKSSQIPRPSGTMADGKTTADHGEVPLFFDPLGHQLVYSSFSPTSFASRDRSLEIDRLRTKQEKHTAELSIRGRSLHMPEMYDTTVPKGSLTKHKVWPASKVSSSILSEHAELLVGVTPKTSQYVVGSRGRKLGRDEVRREQSQSTSAQQASSGVRAAESKEGGRGGTSDQHQNAVVKSIQKESHQEEQDCVWVNVIYESAEGGEDNPFESAEDVTDEWEMVEADTDA